VAGFLALLWSELDVQHADCRPSADDVLTPCSILPCAIAARRSSSDKLHGCTTAASGRRLLLKPRSQCYAHSSPVSSTAAGRQSGPPHSAPVPASKPFGYDEQSHPSAGLSSCHVRSTKLRLKFCAHVAPKLAVDKFEYDNIRQVERLAIRIKLFCKNCAPNAHAQLLRLHVTPS
jgi:hypothetical protein